MNENVLIWIQISLKFVRKGPINNNPSLVQIMAWRRPGDKPLCEPMMIILLTHICVTRPQWVKTPLRCYSFQLRDNSILFTQHLVAKYVVIIDNEAKILVRLLFSLFHGVWCRWFVDLTSSPAALHYFSDTDKWEEFIQSHGNSFNLSPPYTYYAR